MLYQQQIRGYIGTSRQCSAHHLNSRYNKSKGVLIDRLVEIKTMLSSPFKLGIQFSCHFHYRQIIRRQKDMPESQGRG